MTEELSQGTIDNAFRLTADNIRQDLILAVVLGCVDDAKALAISLVRATRPDLELSLVEDPAVWSGNAEEKESVNHD
jgi:hypothetical protein